MARFRFPAMFGPTWLTRSRCATTGQRTLLCTASLVRLYQAVRLQGGSLRTHMYRPDTPKQRKRPAGRIFGNTPYPPAWTAPIRSFDTMQPSFNALHAHLRMLMLTDTPHFLNPFPHTSSIRVCRMDHSLCCPFLTLSHRTLGFSKEERG